jgi:bifunctional DNase/RNase
VRIELLIGLALVLALPARAEELKVERTEVRVSSVGPAVLLRVGNRAIPVFVDQTVAESIQGALSGRKPVRPLTHDLMHNVLAGFDGRVTKVVVTLHDGIFYGALTVVVRGTSKVFDSRSSDAIALAIHAGAPILVSRQLLDSVGIDLEDKK